MGRAIGFALLAAAEKLEDLSESVLAPAHAAGCSKE